MIRLFAFLALLFAATSAHALESDVWCLTATSSGGEATWAPAAPGTPCPTTDENAQAQGAAISGAKGVLDMGSVSSAAPSATTYTTGTIQPVILNTNGNLKVEQPNWTGAGASYAINTTSTCSPPTVAAGCVYIPVSSSMTTMAYTATYSGGAAVIAIAGSVDGTNYFPIANGFAAATSGRFNIAGLSDVAFYVTGTTSNNTVDVAWNQSAGAATVQPLQITASATGTTTATTATLAASTSLHTYICGFNIRADATAAATGNATVTGVVTGTLNFTQWTAPLASGVGDITQNFNPCLPSSAINTSIAVVSAAPGSGGTVSVSAWGYQQ